MVGRWWAAPAAPGRPPGSPVLASTSGWLRGSHAWSLMRMGRPLRFLCLKRPRSGWAGTTVQIPLSGAPRQVWGKGWCSSTLGQVAKGWGNLSSSPGLVPALRWRLRNGLAPNQSFKVSHRRTWRGLSPRALPPEQRCPSSSRSSPGIQPLLNNVHEMILEASQSGGRSGLRGQQPSQVLPTLSSSPSLALVPQVFLKAMVSARCLLRRPR